CGMAVVAVGLLRRRLPLGLHGDRSTAVGAAAPLGDVVVMRAPVGQLAAGIVVPPAEFIMAALLDVIDRRRRAEPHFPIQLLRRLLDLEWATLGIRADARLDPGQLADPTVADQLARQAESPIRSLLAANLENAIRFLGNLDQRFAFLDGQGQRLLAVDIL